MQARLRDWGVRIDDADGEFGLWTEAAIYSLQRLAGLVPDGLVGPATQARLVGAAPAGMQLDKPLVRCLQVPYRTQRDNEHEPLGTCNVTTLAMGLLSFGVRPDGADRQLEDELYELLQSDAAAAFYRENSPELFKRKVPSHEVHDNLAWAARQHGVPASFSGHRSRADFDGEIGAGRPVLLSGGFTGSGHIVLLIGFTADRDLIVHDPYGDWTTRYKDLHGEARIYERDRAWTTLKDTDSETKWGLFFS